MADPLSIAGLAIGALQASAETSGALLKLYSSLKNAPDLIAALSNEASDTRAVLLRVQDACDALSKLATPQAAEFLQSLQDLVGDAKARLAELDSLAKRLEAEKGVRMRVKWVLQDSNAASLKVQLREVRTKISDVLVSSTSASASHMQLELADIKVLVPQSHSETQAKIDGLSGVVESVLNKTEQNTKRLDDLSILMQTLVVEQSWTLYKTRLKGGQSTNSKPRTQQRPISIGNEQGRREGSFYSQALFLINLRPSMASCADECPCCCHRPPAARGRPSNLVPAMLKAYLGGLFVGYNGGPDKMAACDSRHCAKEKKAHVQVSYAFPAWCALPPLHLLVESSSHWRFKIDLVHKRVGSDFRYSLLNALFRCDLPTVKRVLDLDPMAAREIDPTDGRSSLLDAVELWILKYDRGYGLAEAVKYLLFTGADPDQENIEGRSARGMVAWALLGMPAHHHQRATWEEIGRLLNISDYLDDLEIPFLHKVISGICLIPIDGFLSGSVQDPSFDINVTSFMNQTALSLACRRGDEASVRALLRHGADCSSGVVLGNATISAAYSDLIVAALIEAGADTSWDGGVYTAACKNNGAAIRTLVQAGASPYGRDPDLIPLIDAACFNAPDAIQALCELGATVDARDSHGFTALHKSILRNSHESLRVLLEHGADHRLKTGWPRRYRRTILDLAADEGDVETMDIVTSLDLRGFNVSSDNYNGRVMRNYFEARSLPPTDELREAFERMFAAAARASLEPWPEEGSESESEEVWEEEEEEAGSAESDEDRDEQDIFFDAKESPVG
ncbi:hypothetical protein MAPG_01943 [Magnaporthiopsis poae ATCC 64411]|uniref:Fungal N-terminal domain-containing protein n=1 Tax=Magnaporthiopsis poae (strain ATCC 64411 / 73-15) TaxID=644358 RepID=A0A0C4DQ10_MAGP6|nr:hypothetical protein MAPG_01943 [Magnaporthiopsis poae ATCC 64411]